MHQLDYATILENYSGSVFDALEKTEYSADVVKHGIDSLVRQLNAFGIKKGDVVGISFNDGLLFAVHFFALSLMDAVPLLLHGGQKENEIRKLREHVDWYLSDTSSNASQEQIKLENLGHRAVHAEPVERPVQGFSSGQKVFLHPTSGSTGETKFCLRDEYGAIAEPINYIESIGISDGSTILSSLPMNHAYGFGLCFLSSFISSSRLILFNNLNPKWLEKLFAEEKVDVFPTVPVIAKILAELKTGRPVEGPGKTITAGSVLESHVAEKFFNKFNKHLYPLYGTTETGGISVARQGGVREDGNVGPKLKYTEVKLVRDPDVDKDVIYVKNPSKMLGYMKGGDMDASAFVDREWFPTQDLGRLNDSGEIVISGRLSAIINVFGYKVDPNEVAQCIKTCRGVGDVHVYAGRHSSGSDLVYAAVELSNPKLKPSDILKFCKDNLPSKKIPSKLFPVDKIPRSPTGKILRDELPK